MRNFIQISFITFIILLITGCSVKSVMIGEEDFACSNSKLEEAGVCGSATYIYKNIEHIEKESYKGYKKHNGIYIKCEKGWFGSSNCEEENND